MAKYSNERLAQGIRVARAKKKVSQASIARSINVDPKTVSGWENGDGGMTVTNAWALADLFGISIDELVGRE